MSALCLPCAVCQSPTPLQVAEKDIEAIPSLPKLSELKESQKADTSVSSIPLILGALCHMLIRMALTRTPGLLALALALLPASSQHLPCS